MENSKILKKDIKILADLLLQDAYLLQNWQRFCTHLGIQNHHVIAWKRQINCGILEFPQLIEDLLATWWSLTKNPTFQSLCDALQNAGFLGMQALVLKNIPRFKEKEPPMQETINDDNAVKNNTVAKSTFLRVIVFASLIGLCGYFVAVFGPFEYFGNDKPSIESNPSSLPNLCLSQVVEELCKHGVVVGGKTRFSTALGTPIGKKIQWEDRYTMGTASYGSHEHFFNLLEDWIERRGSKATLGELGKILSECEFIAASESLKSLGAEDVILKNKQCSLA